MKVRKEKTRFTNKGKKQASASVGVVIGGVMLADDNRCYQGIRSRDGVVLRKVCCTLLVLVCEAFSVFFRLVAPLKKQRHPFCL